MINCRNNDPDFATNHKSMARNFGGISVNSRLTIIIFLNFLTFFKLVFMQVARHYSKKIWLVFFHCLVSLFIFFGFGFGSGIEEQLYSMYSLLCFLNSKSEKGMNHCCLVLTQLQLWVFQRACLEFLIVFFTVKGLCF